MEPYVLASLNFPLEAPQLGADPRSSVAAELYRASLQAGSHSEGSDCVRALLGYVADLRRYGAERAADSVILERLRAALDYGQRVLTDIPETQAVVLYGSVLRGKPQPNDCDFRIVTLPMDPDLSDYVHPRMNAIQERVNAALESSSSIPSDIAGIKIERMINSSFNDVLGLELEYVQRGPYLAIMRGSREGALATFLNTAGTKYLEERIA